MDDLEEFFKIMLVVVILVGIGVAVGTPIVSEPPQKTDRELILEYGMNHRCVENEILGKKCFKLKECIESTKDLGMGIVTTCEVKNDND